MNILAPRCVNCALILVSFLFLTCNAWEWSDFLTTGSIFKSSDTLSMAQVSEMRVRDIKRRLARTHGFDASELGRMLDKKELIHALAFEEHKVRQAENAEFQRQLFIQATIATVLAGALVLFWPLLKHLYEVAHVNFVVYTDRKLLEARRCWELKSFYGSVGVCFMFIVDFLQIWLTVSVILSWVMTSKYFFPVPSLPIRPAAMMGGQVSNGPLARYGLNVGPMVITWGLRFLQGRLETWTGRALSDARRAQTEQSKKQRRENETPEEKEVRRAARRARRDAREEEKRKAAAIRQTQSRREEMDDSAFPEFDDFNQTDKTEPSIDEKRISAATAAESRSKQETIDDSYTAMDELD
jgi:hypothetical protein